MDISNKLSETPADGIPHGEKKIYYHELTPAQKSIDSLQRFYGGTSISCLCGAVIFEESLDIERLMEALRLLIRRHEALRLVFRTIKGRTVQYVSEGYSQTFEYKKFSSYGEMRGYCNKQAKKPFELNGEEMYRITVFDLPDRSGIMLCASHLIADAWTYSILAKDVFEIYNGICEGRAVDTDVRKYTDCIEKYAAYQSSKKYERDLSYWSQRYSGGVGATEVRHGSRSAESVSAGRYTTAVPPELSMAVVRSCKERALSPAALFESVMLIYLSRINGDDGEVTIGVPLLGRSSAAEKKTAGMFVSTLPLTLRVDESEGVAELCRRTLNAHKEIYRHRVLPYEDILKAVRKNSGSYGRIYDVLVSFQNAGTDTPARTEWFSNGYSEIPLAVHIDDRDSSGSFTLTIDYQTDVFSDGKEIELFAKRILHMIEQIVRDGGKAVKDISVLPKEEYDLLIRRFDRTSARYPRDKCVHEAFSERAARRGDRTALIFHGRGYTYRKLDEMSDALAYILRDKGIGRNDIVPLIARRSPYVIAAMLAVMKAGGAYMPVSPELPAKRIEYMMKSVGAKLALTYGCDCGFAEELKLEEIDYSYRSQAVFECSPDDPCYAIFTSGSTGKPKGTVLTHRNVMNYCAEDRSNIFGKIIDGDRKSIVSVTDIVFDIFVTESILALLNGVVIVLADDEQATSQRALSKLVTETRAEVIQTTPTKMRSFLFDKKDLGFLSCLRTIILGGEELPASLCRELKKYTDADIYNVYGPAETTVWSSSAAVCEKDIHIGRPIANTQIYILDNKSEPVPVGVMGEICISGDGVGRGYINAPELTAEKFLPDPFCEGNTMYRTGDLGVIRADGNIEFCGRRDRQIKLRGQRLELGEIECAMSSFRGIDNAAVLCGKTVGGEQYLAGYYTSREAIDETALSRSMRRTLPSYMIPNRFVRLSHMPMTPSGKIDRTALPEIDLSAPVKQSYTPPVSETERQLCSAMAKTLGVSRVGRDDDFFDLGGDSFSAMSFAARAEEMGYDFSVRRVYECRTVERLCKTFADKKKVCAYEKKLRRYPMKRTYSDRLFFKLFVWSTRALYSLEVTGLENIDPRRKYIICPNHESDLDCMWVWSALSSVIDINDTCALIAEEHLDKPLSRYIFRISGGIPIDREGDFMPSLKRASACLKKQKRLLLIHPEGTRTRTGKLGKFKNGAALIAIALGVETIPVFISGARDIYPVTRKIPKLFDTAAMKRFTLRICFGEPVDPAGKTAQQLTAEMQSRVLEMKRKTN